MTPALHRRCKCGLDCYFYAITAHFGQWVTDIASGKTRWQVALDLLYGQVKKSYRRRKLALVERRMRLGDIAHLTDRLKTLGFSGSLNTAFVERINLTLRHALAALSRRSWATAQLTGELLAHLQWWRAYYHFCRPHASLRLKLDRPQPRQGQQTPRRFQPRTPATLAPHASAGVAAGLTDHIWSVQELLAFPVGQELGRRDGGVGSPPKNKSQRRLSSQNPCSRPSSRALEASKSSRHPLRELSHVKNGSTDGMVNVVVPPVVYEQCRQAIRSAFVIIEGIVQKEHGAINVLAAVVHEI